MPWIKSPLTLEPGHIYGLLGNNGAGKKHLAQYLTDRQLPDQGTVTVDGQTCETTMPPYTKFSWWESRTFSPKT